jgi:pyruvate dehydrogenase E1 component beta subunit
VTLVATGYMVKEALDAAEELAQRGISAEIIDPRTLSPLDMDTIVKSVQKTSRAVVVQEAVNFCGLGAEIAASIQERAFDYLDAPVKRVGAPFSPVPFAPVLEQAWLPGKAEVIAAVEEIVPA